MIAGDHLDADAGRAAVACGLQGLRAGRVDQAQKAQENQPALDVDHCQPHCVVLDRERRHGQHTLAVRGETLDVAMPAGHVQDAVAARGALGPAHLEHAFRCAFDMDDGRVVGRGVQRRHVAMPSVERDLVEAPEALPRGRRLEASLGGENQQCRLHWIAFDRPACMGPPEMSVVAEQGSQRNLAEDRIVGGLDRPFRRVPDPRHREAPVGRDYRLHGHLVAGERAGLVTADRRHRSERLDRGQAADDGVPGRHPTDPDRERDRHHRRQAFRDHGNRKADDGHECVGDRVAAHGDGKQEDDGGAGQGDQGDLSGEAVHLADQRRAK